MGVVNREMKLKPAIMMIKKVKNFPLYLADYFNLLGKKEIIYHLRDGTKFKVRTQQTDRVGLNEVWIYNVYCPKGFELNENDTVVDIGGHIGMFSVFAAKQCKKGKIYTFEPCNENFKLLKENIMLNNCENIIAFKKAVSSENTEKDLFLYEDDYEAHSFFKKNDEAEKITVKTISLTNFLKENNINKIDFLKIDCEGAEYEILYSCNPEIFKKIKVISMEYHNVNKILEKQGLEPIYNENFNGQNLASFLQKNGFEVTIKITDPKGGMLYAKRKE